MRVAILIPFLTLVIFRTTSECVFASELPPHHSSFDPISGASCDPNTILVELSPVSSLQAALANWEDHGFKVSWVETLPRTLRQFYVLTLPFEVDCSREMLEALQSWLGRHASFVEYNHTFTSFDAPTDPDFLTQQASTFSGIRLQDSWLISTKVGAGIVVAVLDTGVDTQHVDLKVNLLDGWNFNWIGGGNDNEQDTDGHGTHVAGLVIAAKNSVGVVGSAWNAKVLPLKVTDFSDVFTDSAVYKGFVFAADNPSVRVINASFGGASYSEVMADGVQYASGKGKVIVAAAGNTGKKEEAYYPAALPNVIAVSNVNVYSDGSVALSATSSYGSYIDVGAPGLLYSSYVKAGDPKCINIGLCSGTSSSYCALCGGTSQSAPLVSGVIAMILSEAPGLSAEGVTNILFATANEPSALNVPVDNVGNGVVNAFRALDSLWPPVISIDIPLASATVGTSEVLRAQVTDNNKKPEADYTESLTSVSFEIITCGGCSAWAMTYNSTLHRWVGDLGPYITKFNVPDGSHIIRVVAKDVSGLNTSYATRSIVVKKGTSTVANCGDKSCDATAGETCSSCPFDCGQCPICGDKVCQASIGETCSNCNDCKCGVDCTCNALGTLVQLTVYRYLCTNNEQSFDLFDSFDPPGEQWAGEFDGGKGAYFEYKPVKQDKYIVFHTQWLKPGQSWQTRMTNTAGYDSGWANEPGNTTYHDFDVPLEKVDAEYTLYFNATTVQFKLKKFNCGTCTELCKGRCELVEGCSCGTCSGTSVVCENSFCVSTDPCAGKECGDGCGTCAADKKCVSGKCECSGICVGGKKLCATKDTYFTCGDSDGNGCLQWSSSTMTCKSNEICSNDQCVCEYSSCGSSCCASGQVCSTTTGACCTPSCTGKKCGDDGCGASCGSCSVPPLPACDVDGKTLLTYSGTGTCSSGTCTYPQTKQPCQYSCSNGSCVSDPCSGKNCPTCQKCSAGACVADTTKNGVVCDDGNVCTSSTTCQSGSCSGGKTVVCDDNKPCTIDTCDTTKGCIVTDATPSTLCNDSNACTTGDYCFSGSCIGKYLVKCDDGNACTTDSCDTNVGCKNTVKQCPAGQTCQNGSCVSDPCAGKNCPMCQKCSGGICVLDTNGTTCNDNDACTTSDVCTNGVCVGVSNPLTCKPAGDICGNAFVITPGALPYTVNGSTADAGGDYGYSTGKCPPETGGWGAGSKDEVYSFKPTVTGAYNIKFTAHDFDANLYVVTNCASVDTTCVAGDEDVGNSALESVSVTLTANTSYFIVIDGYPNVAPGWSGTYTLSVESSCVPACSGKVCGDDGCGSNCGSCSGGQTCQNGSCVSDPCASKTCSFCQKCDAGGCVTDPAKHLVTACNDGDACTKGDICMYGSCVGMTFVSCDDGDSCTLDSCDSKSGCLHQTKSCPGGQMCTNGTCSDPGLDCNSFCALAMQTCTGANALWPSLNTCLSTCATWPLGAPGDTSGNSLACRLYHVGAAAAVDPSIHCSHAGADGGGVCVGCASNCSGKTCGDDGCGGDCGMCQADQVCVAGACAPALSCDSFCALAMQACTGVNALWSSLNACLSTCSTWPVGTMGSTSGNSLACRLYHVGVAGISAEHAAIHCPHAGADGDGVCVGCYPNCDGKACGDDSCGGSCGACEKENVCESGSCKGVQCAPCINGCASGFICLSWTYYPSANWCALSCNSDKDCPAGNACKVPQGGTTGSCTPTQFVGCVGNDVALEDSCGNVLTTYQTCVSPQSCVDGSCVCTSQCSGKSCGDDGCGGSCGTCNVGEKCVGNTCTAPPLGDTCGNPFSVPGLPFAYIGDTKDANPDYGFDDYKCPGSKGKGNASNDEVFKFVPNTTADYVILLDAMFDSALYVATDCLSINTSCLAGADTSKTEKVTLKLTKGTAYFIIVDGYSNTANISGEYILSVDKTCVPNCSGKQCGDDGCGGSCGSCASGKQCSSAGSCVDCLGTAACDDGNKCTSADACKNGKCVGTSKVCDDGNPCTDDTCDPTNGCSLTPKSCPNGGTCKNGKCPSCVPDQYEPDGSVATASLINLGESQTRSICPDGDPDYVRIVLEKSEVVAVSVQGDTVDLALGIYGSKGELATINTNGEGWTEFYEEALQPDQYVVVVSQAGPGEGGTYTLTITSSCSPQCDNKKCGDDGCGGNCGTCKEHYACNGGNCYWQPYCGDFDCRWKEDENCETCPQDCKCASDQSCVSGTCVVVVEPIEPTPDVAVEEADVFDTSGGVTDAGSAPTQATPGEQSSGCAAAPRSSMLAVAIALLLFFFLVLFRMRRQRH